MKKLSVLLPICLIFASAAHVFAYYSDTAEAGNAFHIAAVTTVIEEEYENPGTISPGDRIGKTVRIRNSGNVPCYVRVQVLFSDSDMERLCTPDMNCSDWAYSESDGWWYYRPALAAGGRTTPLFTTVSIDGGCDPEELFSFELYIRQESRQASGSDSFSDAWNL